MKSVVCYDVNGIGALRGGREGGRKGGREGGRKGGQYHFLLLKNIIEI